MNFVTQIASLRDLSDHALNIENIHGILDADADYMSDILIIFLTRNPTCVYIHAANVIGNMAEHLNPRNNISTDLKDRLYNKLEDIKRSLEIFLNEETNPLHRYNYYTLEACFNALKKIIDNLQSG